MKPKRRRTYGIPVKVFSSIYVGWYKTNESPLYFTKGEMAQQKLVSLLPISLQ
jgi:hypothetical protein